MLAQGLNHQRDRGFLLASGDINAVHARAFLSDDRVHAERGLADLAVADDQFALAASNRGHRVNSLVAGVARFMHALSSDNAGGDNLHLAGQFGIERPLAVDGLADAVHNPAFQLRPDWHFGDAACAADDVAFHNFAAVAHDRHADIVLLKVEGQAHDAAGKFQQLHGLAVLHAIDAGDAVAHGDDRAGLLEVYAALVACDLIFNDPADFRGFDLHLTHTLPLMDSFNS